MDKGTKEIAAGNLAAAVFQARALQQLSQEFKGIEKSLVEFTPSERGIVKIYRRILREMDSHPNT